MAWHKSNEYILYIIVILLAYDDPVLRSGLSSMNIYYQYMDTVEQLLENLRRWPNIGLLLAHRLRRWPSSNPMLCQRLMFFWESMRIHSHASYPPCQMLHLIENYSHTRESYHFIVTSYQELGHYQTKIKCWPAVDSMLGQRRRRWANIESSMGRSLVIAWYIQNTFIHRYLHKNNE